MEAHSSWYDKTVKEINLYKDTLNQKDQKKYKMDLLQRVARRVDYFSTSCGQCQLHQQDINSLITELSLLTQMPSKEGIKNHSRKINNMVKHLQKEHKLVTEGYYMGIGVAIGIGVGTALGAVTEKTGIGTAIGTGIGIAIGAYLDKKAKKEDRII